MPLRGYGDDSEKISDYFVAWTIQKIVLKATLYYFAFISENSVHNLQALSAKIKVFKHPRISVSISFESFQMTGKRDIGCTATIHLVGNWATPTMGPAPWHGSLYGQLCAGHTH